MAWIVCLSTATTAGYLFELCVQHPLMMLMLLFLLLLFVSGFCCNRLGTNKLNGTILKCGRIMAKAKQNTIHYIESLRENCMWFCWCKQGTRQIYDKLQKKTTKQKRTFVVVKCVAVFFISLYFAPSCTFYSQSGPSVSVHFRCKFSYNCYHNTVSWIIKWCTCSRTAKNSI